MVGSVEKPFDGDLGVKEPTVLKWVQLTGIVDGLRSEITVDSTLDKRSKGGT